MNDDLPTLNLRDLARQAFTQALARTDGHLVRAAEIVGVSAKTAYNMAHRYGIPLPHPEMSRLKPRRKSS